MICEPGNGPANCHCTFGDWDRYEITSKDAKMTVMLNGKLVNEGFDAKPAHGNMGLQSEGWKVHYRNVAIKELP